MNGWQFDEITDASQCTLYRGSKGVGYSKLVSANKVYDLQTSTDYDNKGTPKEKGDDAITYCTPEEKKAGYKCYSSSHDGDETIQISRSVVQYCRRHARIVFCKS